MWAAAAIGFGGASIPILLNAVISRRKNRAEADSLKASAADVLAHGAVSLVPYYEKRIEDLERRVSKAEGQAQTAAADAYLARTAEAECRSRLSKLETDVAALRATLATATKTVTTAITTHETETP